MFEPLFSLIMKHRGYTQCSHFYICLLLSSLVRHLMLQNWINIPGVSTADQTRMVIRLVTHSSYSICSDGHLIPYGSSFTEVFDFFKVFVGFLLAYPCGLNTFLKFFLSSKYTIYGKGLEKFNRLFNDVARQLKL
jgi:hypothetical protein